MSKVAVVYWSGTGHTAAMAAQVMEGIKKAGGEGTAEFSARAIALFGSYGWGSGEWMEDWENRCRTAGAVLACDCVICNGAPDENACADCVALGEALA